jgi:hypothetical protein
VPVGQAAAQPVPVGQAAAQPVPVGQAAAQPVPVGQAAPAATGAGAALTSPAGSAGGALLGATTADEQIIDVPDDSQQNNAAELSATVTSLPPDVQMQGYRIMWGVAGVMALGAALVSWFGREVDEYEVSPGPAAATPSAQERRVPVVAGAER